jgi:2'-5' RNA ligase
VRDDLAAWRDAAVGERDELRPVRAEALHVTLVFLGWRALKEAPAIAEAAFESLAGLPAPELAPLAVKPLPPRRPRLFALDLDDPGGRTVRAQTVASEALERAAGYRPEKRPFWPHVTLARVKRGRPTEPWEGPPPPGDPFEADIVTLYRSILEPQGARYEPLERTRLGKG